MHDNRQQLSSVWLDTIVNGGVINVCANPQPKQSAGFLHSINLVNLLLIPTYALELQDGRKEVGHKVGKRVVDAALQRRRF